MAHAPTGQDDMTATRILLLEIGSRQSRLPDLIARMGELHCYERSGCKPL